MDLSGAGPGPSGASRGVARRVLTPAAPPRGAPRRHRVTPLPPRRAGRQHSVYHTDRTFDKADDKRRGDFHGYGVAWRWLVGTGRGGAGRSADCRGWSRVEQSDATQRLSTPSLSALHFTPRPPWDALTAAPLDSMHFRSHFRESRAVEGEGTDATLSRAQRISAIAFIVWPLVVSSWWSLEKSFLSPSFTLYEVNCSSQVSLHLGLL